MNRYISLLRGINVSGQKKIKMADLRQLYDELGFANVKSYVQSGNVLFDSDSTDRVALIANIEAKIEAAYQFHVPVQLRTADQMLALIEQNPYDVASDDNKHQYILFLDRALNDDEIGKLVIPEKWRDEFVSLGDALAIYYPNGAGRGKLTTNYVERKLGISGTMRNWRSVNKLYALTQA